MGDWETYFGGNPTPGDPVMVKVLGKDLSKTGREAEIACKELEGIQRRWKDAVWEGPAADDFREFISSLPTDLAKLQASYALAGSALQTYADELQSAQRDAQQALDDAKLADTDKQSANTALGEAEQRRLAALKSRNSYDTQLRAISHKLTLPYPPGDPTPHNLQVKAKGLRDGRKIAQRDLDAAATDKASAQRKVDDAQVRLSAANRLASQAKHLQEDAARRAEQKVDAASDAGIRNKSSTQKVIDWTVKAYRDPLSALDDIERNLKAIGAVLATVGAVLYVIALCVPGLNVLVAAISLVVLAISVLALACTLVLWANGRRSGWDVIWGAAEVGLGLVGARGDLGVVSKGAGAFSKGARTGGVGKGLSQVNKEFKARSALAEILGAKGSKYKAFRNYLLGHSETAGAIKRVCWWRDARRATGALHFAHVTRRGWPTFRVLLTDGGEIALRAHDTPDQVERLKRRLRRARSDWSGSRGPIVAPTHFVTSYFDPVEVRHLDDQVQGTHLRVPGRPPVRVE